MVECTFLEFQSIIRTSYFGGHTEIKHVRSGIVSYEASRLDISIVKDSERAAIRFWVYVAFSLQAYVQLRRTYSETDQNSKHMW